MKHLTALVLALFLAACETTPYIGVWTEPLDPYMKAAGWTIESNQDENYYDILKNGVPIWRKKISCARMCLDIFMPPGELSYAAELQFTTDLNAAKSAYLEKVSTQIGIEPVAKPEEPTE